jgi:hypothetical protein
MRRSTVAAVRGEDEEALSASMQKASSSESVRAPSLPRQRAGERADSAQRGASSGSLCGDVLARIRGARCGRRGGGGGARRVLGRAPSLELRAATAFARVGTLRRMLLSLLRLLLRLLLLLPIWRRRRRWRRGRRAASRRRRERCERVELILL